MPRRPACWLLVSLIALAVGCVSPGPETILTQAAEAARNNDREALLACFTPRSRPLIQLYWAQVDAHNPPLGFLGAGEVEVLAVQRAPARDYQPERALIQFREAGQEGYLYAHLMGGMWRIDLLDTEQAMTRGLSDL